jgi:WXG100 family type VII secretion target
MATAESAVNRAAMATAAQQVESAVTVIRGLQSNMNGYNASLQGGWQGQASSAFASTYEAFNADFAKVLNALQGIQERLVSTHSTYSTTEDTNTQQVSRVQSALGGS